MQTKSLFDLTGKVALVTGGNRGIGLAMANALAEAGAHTVIWGTNDQRNRMAAEELSAHGREVMYQTVNVAIEDQIVAAVAEIDARFGRIDSVFAVAGVGGEREEFIKLTTQNLRSVMAVNVEGVVWTFREAARSMVARATDGSGGSLVAIASLGAVHGMPKAEAYSMSKGMLGSLVRSLAVELGPYGIRANAVVPGWIETDFAPVLQTPGAISKLLPRVPAGRWGRPADLAGIAVYLASNASAYHNGDSLLIDGGYACY